MSLGFGQIVPALKTLLNATAHRGELATLELGEARDHLTITVALGLGAAALIMLGGFAGTFTIAALVWDRPDRGLILGALTAGYFMIAGGFVWFAVQRLRTWRPLEETCRQLRADRVVLEEALTPAPEPNSSYS